MRWSGCRSQEGSGGGLNLTRLMLLLTRLTRLNLTGRLVLNLPLTLPLRLQRLITLEIAFVDINARAGAGALHVAHESIAAGKLAAALFAVVGLFAGVQFHVPLEVVQPAELGVARFARERFFVRVRQQMRLEVVVSRERVFA